MEESKEKMVTATKKGGAVLDQWLPDNIKSSFHVLQHVYINLFALAPSSRTTRSDFSPSETRNTFASMSD